MVETVIVVSKRKRGARVVIGRRTNRRSTFDVFHLDINPSFYFCEMKSERVEEIKEHFHFLWN